MLLLLLWCVIYPPVSELHQTLAIGQPAPSLLE